MNNTFDESKGWSSDKKLSESLFAMIPLGVGEVIGGLVLGKILDKLGHRSTLVFIIVVTAVAYALLFTYIEIY